MTTGILVVTYQSGRHLPRMLQALSRQTEADWRLIVVDNASKMEERPAQDQLPPGARLIQLQENTGFAAANNLAAASLNSPVEFLACLNPDAFPESDWLEQLVAAARRHPGAAAFGSLQLLDHDPTLLDGAGDVMTAYGVPYRGGYRAPRHPLPAEAETFSACAAAALYRREAFVAAGGFDETFFSYCEDVDLGYRLRLGGGRCIQVNTAIVRHVSGGSASRTSDFAVRHGARNRFWTFIKNTPAPLLVLMFIPHLAVTGAAILAHLVAGRPAGLQGLTEGWRALPRILRARKAVQANRKISTFAIARALAWNPLRLVTRTPVLVPLRDEPAAGSH